jgi:hypothetical protein
MKKSVVLVVVSVLAASAVAGWLATGPLGRRPTWRWTRPATWRSVPRAARCMCLMCPIRLDR